ncbi:MAG: CHRD domain-containing protein [Chloroflexota bacterium]|nr:CHRD domain-containing protein [Chloroflexota bacterium]
MKRPIAPLLVGSLVALLVALALLASGGSVEAANGGRPLSTTLSGAAEVPGPGDPDGSGTAMLRVNPGQGQICHELMVSGIAPARAAHIHEAPTGAAGPVVVGLAPPTSGMSSGCVSVSRELALDILMNPENYYVNVHNAEFPAGALRGQLSK